MTDEELRKFCIEQAVVISINQKPPTGIGCPRKSVSLFELSNALFDYVRLGVKPKINITFPFEDAK